MLRNQVSCTFWIQNPLKVKNRKNNNLKGFFILFLLRKKIEIQFFHKQHSMNFKYCDTLVYYDLKNGNFIWRSRQYAYVKCEKYFHFMI